MRRCLTVDSHGLSPVPAGTGHWFVFGRRAERIPTAFVRGLTLLYTLMANIQTQPNGPTYNYQAPYGYSAQGGQYAGPSSNTNASNTPFVLTSPQYSGVSGHQESGIPGLPMPEAAPEVTHAVASRAMERLLSAGLKEQGFDGAEPLALKRLQTEIEACGFIFIPF